MPGVLLEIDGLGTEYEQVCVDLALRIVLFHLAGIVCRSHHTWPRC